MVPKVVDKYTQQGHDMTHMSVKRTCVELVLLEGSRNLTFVVPNIAS
jgi:hypothetical protein